jgi:hypothetical protein
LGQCVGIGGEAPITHIHVGKQYIVVAVGGREVDPEWVALSLL